MNLYIISSLPLSVFWQIVREKKNPGDDDESDIFDHSQILSRWLKRKLGTEYGLLEGGPYKSEASL